MPASREPVLAKSEFLSPASQGSASDVRIGSILLAGITLVGAWLRLWHLGDKSLWLDEAAAVALARLPWSRFVHEWWYGAASFQTTHLLLLRVWVHLLPATEVLVRLPSALFGIASIPLLYSLARRVLRSADGALASAAMLAVSPAHVYYSQETRSYVFTIFLLLLSAIFFVRAVDRNENRDWAVWTIFSILAVYAHYFAALVLLAQACSVLFLREPAIWKKLVPSGLLILAASLPGMTYVFRAPEFSSFSWMPRTTFLGVLHVAMFLGGSGVKFGIVAVLWIAGTVSIARSRSNDAEPARWRGWLVLLWAVLPVALLAVASLHRPMFVNRYMIFSLPATVMLAGWGMGALPGKQLGRALVIILCALCIPTVIKDYRKPREDWRGATAALLSSAQPGDAVVFVPEFTRVAFDYYAERSPQLTPTLRFFSPPYYGTGQSLADLERDLAAHPRQFPHVWVVIIREFGDKEILPASDDALEAKLRSLFGVPEVRHFQAITVSEFRR